MMDAADGVDEVQLNVGARLPRRQRPRRHADRHRRASWKSIAMDIEFQRAHRSSRRCSTTTSAPGTPSRRRSTPRSPSSTSRPSTSRGRAAANRYALFSETIAEGDAQPSLPGLWNAWENNGTASSIPVTTDVAEGTTSRRITPTPLAWGWGMAFALPVADNLTNFNAAEGRLNFSIKTTYPGKLEVGFFTGATSARNGVDAYITIQSGEHGYLNDGEWHEVSIPIATIAAAAVPAYGQSPTAMLDMALVYAGFVIADRFAATGNPTTGVRPDILLDNIYWSK
jgi:hypothetical protein